MSIQIREKQDGKLMVVRAEGKVTRADMEQFIPYAERLIRQHGKIKMLLEADGFEGWDGDAFLQDMKFGVEHAGDIERMAVVGDKDWHKWAAKLAEPLTEGEVKYFEPSQKTDAGVWIENGGS